MTKQKTLPRELTTVSLILIVFTVIKMSEEEKIVYRFATADDRDQIYDFALKALNDPRLPDFAEDIGDELLERIRTGDPTTVLLALNGKTNEIIGYIEMGEHKTIKGKKIFYIRGIYVLPEYRRHGIGRELFNRMLREKCKDAVQIRVDAFTEEGLNFWKNLNFKVHHYALYLNNDPGTC